MPLAQDLLERVLGFLQIRRVVAKPVQPCLSGVDDRGERLTDLVRDGCSQLPQSVHSANVGQLRLGFLQRLDCFFLLAHIACDGSESNGLAADFVANDKEMLHHGDDLARFEVAEAYFTLPLAFAHHGGHHLGKQILPVLFRDVVGDSRVAYSCEVVESDHLPSSAVEDLCVAVEGGEADEVHAVFHNRGEL